MTESTNLPISRALVSVSNKSGLLAFAKFLHNKGVEILSTGGTARILSEEGIPVVEVAEYTGFPEMMDGRLKTLHPKIHGGILGRRGVDDEVMYEHGIPAIDLVVVNLYPFEETVANPGCSLNAAIENIDIGGPAMLRAAAKNHQHITVAVDPDDYSRIMHDMQSKNAAISKALRFDLAVKAFEHTARYDGTIANYLGKLVDDDSEFPRTLSLQFDKVQAMRYGENPHQNAAFYREHALHEVSIARARQLQGKALSYNNIADTDAALECVKQFDAPACVIVKHANPCGVAVADSILSAYDRAFSTDPTSAFGGIIAFNRTLDEKTAETIIRRQFTEVLIAPEIAEGAHAVLGQKKNLRVMECGQWTPPIQSMDFKRVNGGLLVQDRDQHLPDIEALRVVTDRAPSEKELDDLLFAWRVVKFVKSNAIVYARDRSTVGIGAGQMSRVYSAKIAAIKAADEKLEVKGAVMASDAFFPFRDGIDAAHNVGISAVIEPGGSMRDDEVIAAANEHGMAMVFTGMRHFRH